MPSCSRNDVVLVQYPFSDLSAAKVRPAVAIHAPHPSEDVLIVPLTSRITGLLPGEFVLSDWASAGLHVPSAVKRGIYTVHQSLIVKCFTEPGIHGSTNPPFHPPPVDQSPS